MRFSEILETTARRYGEMLLSCCLISAVMKEVVDNNHIRGTLMVEGILASIGLLVFFAANIVLFRRCRFVLGNKTREYSIINCCACLLFAATNIAVLELFGGEHVVYLYLFQIVKAGTLVGLSDLYSALIFDALMLLMIFISQIGMLPILREAEKEMNCRYE